MENFEQIEREFLDTEDDNNLIEFHRKYFEIFNNIEFVDEDATLKKIWILSELSGVYYRVGDNEKCNELTKLSFNLFDRFSEKFNYDLQEDNQYKIFLMEIAGRHFENKRFFKAKRYYQKIKGWEKYKNQIDNSIEISEYHAMKRFNKFFGLFGIILIVINYLIKYFNGNKNLAFIFAIAGGIVIVVFGLLQTYYYKKPTVNIGS